jgi:hypothetical protein
MSIMISDVYDAFIADGAPEDKARKAAEALTVHESRFGKIESELALVKGDLLVLKWMAGFALTLLTAIALKLFMH